MCQIYYPDWRQYHAGTKTKIRVRMRVGEDPRTWDVDTGEELSGQVKEVRILLGRQAVATLNKANEKKNPVIDKPRGEIETFEADVVRIEGIWEAMGLEELG